MCYVVIQHKIGEWSEFESIFRADGERRRRLGCTGGKVLRDVQDPNTVFVIFNWEDTKGALEFANGLETHEAMEWATSGMSSQIHVTEEVFEVEA